MQTKPRRLRLEGRDDPHRGDTIIRLGADDEPSGLTSKVKQIAACDAALALWEVLDDGNRSLIIEQHAEEPQTWMEVRL